MSPKTTPIAPMRSGASRLRSERSESLSTPAERAIGFEDLQRCVVGSTREADVELLELAVKMGPLESGSLGHPAHVALLLAEQLLEVDSLERLSRLPQRKLEEARGELRRDGGRREERRVAEQAPDVLRRDFAVHREREIGDDAVQLVEVRG